MLDWLDRYVFRSPREYPIGFRILFVIFFPMILIAGIILVGVFVLGTLIWDALAFIFNFIAGKETLPVTHVWDDL